MERSLLHQLRCIQTNPSLRAESTLDIVLIECPNSMVIDLSCFHLNTCFGFNLQSVDRRGREGMKCYPIIEEAKCFYSKKKKKKEKKASKPDEATLRDERGNSTELTSFLFLVCLYLFL